MTTRIALSPIPPEEMSDFLVRRARTGDKELSFALGDWVVELAGPVTYRVTSPFFAPWLRVRA